MPERCFKCGRVKCETCALAGGKGRLPAEDFSVSMLDEPCPHCEDGWRGPEKVPCGACVLDCIGPDDPDVHCPTVLGDDTGVYCPECADAK